MKKYIYSALIAGCVLLSSCENDFDAKIYGSLSTTNFPVSASDYESYMMACYDPFVGQWSYNIGATSQHPFYVPEGGLWRMLDFTSDIQAKYIGSWGWQAMTLANFEYLENASRGTNGYTVNHFDKVRDVTRMTKILGDLEQADPTIFTGNKQQELIAEVHLLRGLVLYYLNQFYGPVPVIVDPALVADDEAVSALQRPDLDTYTQYVTEDLEFAASHMPEKQTEQGRYTADYARVCLMRHYLNEGYHMSGYYAKAAALKSQITGSYSLFTKGDNPYKEQFASDNDFNCEVIMALPCTGNATGSGKQGNMNAFNYYAFPWSISCDATQYFTGWDQVFGIEPTFYNTFEADDLRKETILTHAFNWLYDRELGPEDIGDVYWSGYLINKYPFDKAGSYQDNDIPLARWADVLLLHAEAVTRDQNTVIEEAVAEINQIRHRAGLADLTSDKTSSVAAFLDAILMESGHETFFEGHRKTDLIRFGCYYKAMSALGRTPTSQYFPIGQYAIDQAEQAGYKLDQYFTTSHYDGPKR